MIRFETLSADKVHNYVEAERQIERQLQQGTLPKRTRKFFIDLEGSILQDGFEKPIIVLDLKQVKDHPRYATYKVLGKEIYLKKEYLPKNYKNILVCIEQGGSRLWVAQKHSLNIPCVIISGDSYES